MKTLSVVIPTFNRGQVLLDTIALLQQQTMLPEEIIIVDQTKYAEGDAIYACLVSLHKQNVIRYIQRDEASIPKAMNHGLINASTDYVVFLDDDINILPVFIEQHKQVLASSGAYAHVGQVLQPGETPQILSKSYQAGKGLCRDHGFLFSSKHDANVHNCMAGNLCVDRERAINAGGFDENFIGAAYRFETEFCRRMIRHYNKPFFFSPKPVLYHLQCATGGTRNTDHYLVSSSPHHSVGDYYYAMCEGRNWYEMFTYCLKRFFSSIKARFYVRQPWYIPVRFYAELRGFLLARKLHKKGPNYCLKDITEVL